MKTTDSRHSFSVTEQPGTTDLDGMDSLLARMNVNNPRYANIIPKDFMSQSGYYGQVKTKPLPKPLPQIDSGFSLSIIDESGDHAISKKDFAHPLGSNPPSIIVAPRHARNISIDTEHSTTSTPTAYVFGSSAPFKDTNDNQQSETKHRSSSRQMYDPLAGQGLRRPLKEDSMHAVYKLTPSVDDSLASAIEKHRASTSDESSTMSPKATVEAMESIRHHREQRSRARKIRELQDHQQQRHRGRARSRPLIPAPLAVKETPKILESSVDICEVPSSGIDQYTFLPVTPRNTPQRTTGYTPSSAEVSQSPVVLLAEKKPVSKVRDSKKPAKLVLKDRNTARPAPITVHPASSIVSPGPATSATHISVSSQYENALLTGSSMSSGHLNDSPKRRLPSIPPPPMHSIRRIVSTHGLNTKRIPAVVLGAHFPAPPQAVTATTTARKRTSVCSSHISHFKEVRLEARLEALERENKLLEAALMAVLKTSGTLNRCPCRVLGNGRTAPAKLAPAAVITASGERRGSADSDASHGSSASALDVYLGTRLDLPAAIEQAAASS